MENVYWNDVRAFIRKLNIKTGTNYRIPTEAEWEYAAREGGKHVKWAGKSSRSKLDKYAWYASNSNQKTHPVKTKKPNSFGLYDMSGNVWEWVFGWYGEKYYNNPSLNNPGAPGQGNPRLFVEAHGLNFPNDLRAAYRFWFPPDSRYSLIGLRFARDKN